MIILRNTLLFYYLFTLVYSNDVNHIDRVINKTQIQYELVDDYSVKLEVSLKIPAFRMPKKKYKVFFKKPNKLKIKSRGFGVLPKTGIFTSPRDNFDNLDDKYINYEYLSDSKNEMMISGTLITDSLKVDMPNEYARLTFIPKVDVIIDTLSWVIISVVTRIDTLKLFELKNSFENIDKNFFMPTKTIVKYFIKDAKLSKLLSGKVNESVKINNINNIGDMVQGEIQVRYLDYKININLEDRLFD